MTDAFTKPQYFEKQDAHTYNSVQNQAACVKGWLFSPKPTGILARALPHQNLYT